jgi:hypothetical protein
MAAQFSDATRSAALDGIEAAIGTSPTLEIRSGAAPANCATADSGTLLATLTLPSNWLADAVAGLKVQAGDWSGTVSTGGTAGHFRIKQGGTTHWQGSITASAGGGDMVLADTALLAGQLLSLSGFEVEWLDGSEPDYDVLADIDVSLSPATSFEVDVTGMEFIQVSVQSLVHANAVQRLLQVSTDGGATWRNGLGDYLSMSTDGLPSSWRAVRFHFTGATAARSGSITIFQPGGGLFPHLYGQSSSEMVRFIDASNPINRIRIMGGSTSSTAPDAGNLTSGRIQVFGQAG